MLRQDELQARHKQMLDFQHSIAPFTPTVRELGTLWKLNSTSATRYILEKFVSLGWCISRDSGYGPFTRYYAVEAETPVVFTIAGVPSGRTGATRA
jgi:hypothetical protein